MNTFDPKDANVMVRSIALTGFAEDTFIEAEKEEERFIAHVGAQGEVSRSKNANPLGKITVTLKASSPSNYYLNQLAHSDETFPVFVVDRNVGNAMAGGTECWIEKPPALSWGKEEGDIEWVFIVADYTQKMS